MKCRKWSARQEEDSAQRDDFLMFIAIYGINNIGKTTHAKRLVRRLQKLGKKAVYIKYPIYSLPPSGPFLNKTLRSRAQRISEEELQLWFVLNRYQFEPKLKKLLASGQIVIAEDYVGTGIAWGTAKGVSRNVLERMNTFLVQPAVSILLEGERKKEAIEKKHIHEQRNDLIKKCAQVFVRLAQKNRWHRVRVAHDADITAARIWRIIHKALYA